MIPAEHNPDFFRPLMDRAQQLLWIFESLPLPSILISGRGQIYQANQSFLNRFQARERINHLDPVKRFLHPESVQPFHSALGQALGESRPCQLDELVWTTLADNDNRDLFSETSLVPVRDQAGKTVFVVVFIQDISRRRQAEKKLSLSEENFRRLFANAPLGYVMVDREGSIQQVNPTLVRMLGSPGEAETKKINILNFPPLVEAGFSPRLRAALEEGRPMAFDLTYVSKWERELFLHCYITPLPGDEGVQGAMVLLEDRSQTINQRRQREELEVQLRQTQKLDSIGSLASGVAHEINNPLMAIINFAHVIHDQPEDTEINREFAGYIVREGERISKIVNNLLTFSRQQKDPMTPCALGPVIEDTVTLSSQMLKKSDIHLEVDIPGDLPPVLCSRNQMQQVFLNLLTNSRDALLTGENDRKNERRISIRGTTQQQADTQWVVIHLEDNGNGIPAEHMSRIFDPFFTTKQTGKGTGLGLSVSYGILKEHGGRLNAHSREGEGTRMEVWLPVARARPAQANLFSESVRPPREDDPDQIG